MPRPKRRDTKDEDLNQALEAFESVPSPYRAHDLLKLANELWWFEKINDGTYNDVCAIIIAYLKSLVYEGK